MVRQPGSRLSRARERLAKQLPVREHKHPQLRRRVSNLEDQCGHSRRLLEARLADLEESLAEQRRLNLRIAELSDMVTELVGAAARGGGAEFERALARYQRSL